MRIILSIFFFFVSQAVFSQTKMITASDAYKYDNQVVTVKDVIYSSKIYKDSIAVMELGKAESKHPFSIILIKNPKGSVLDEKVINTLKAGKASFTGLIVSNKIGTIMIANTSDKIRFNYRLD